MEICFYPKTFYLPQQTIWAMHYVDWILGWRLSGRVAGGLLGVLVSVELVNE
jgi:hypothetical protein